MSSYNTPLAPSESKSVFTRRLGLDMRDYSHKRLYKSMKSDAIVGYIELTSNRTTLLPQLQADKTVSAPYTYAQICETAMHRAIVDIYNRASDETRLYYDVGHDTRGVETENWVIRWLLWHVFRYRDRRNRSASKASNSSTGSVVTRASLRDPTSTDDDDDTEVSKSPGALPPLQTMLGDLGHALPSPSSARLPYDPARD